MISFLKLKGNSESVNSISAIKLEKIQFVSSTSIFSALTFSIKQKLIIKIGLLFICLAFLRRWKVERFKTSRWLMSYVPSHEIRLSLAYYGSPPLVFPQPSKMFRSLVSGSWFFRSTVMPRRHFPPQVKQVQVNMLHIFLNHNTCEQYGELSRWKHYPYPPCPLKNWVRS